MKTCSRSHSGKALRLGEAFTMPEMMIVVGLFSLVIIGGIYSHLLGLKMSAFTQTKLKGMHSARAILNSTRDEIRAATTVVVGNGGRTTFSNVPPNRAQVGNALQIYPTSDTNTFVRYYIDLNQQELMRKESGSTNAQVIGMFITNEFLFQAEDYAGNVLTNDQNNRVIKMTLEFYQWEFAVL